MVQEKSDMTRREQTDFLSREFLITMGVQTIVFVVMGTMAFSAVDARVKALEAQQVTDARIARIEEKLAAVLDNQRDLRSALDRYANAAVKDTKRTP